MTPPDPAIDLLARIATAPDVGARVALVVAHPDDETLALGARLSHLRRLTLIHVTDGAPRDMGDARRAGFETPEAYTAARARELDAALDAASCEPEQRLAYGLTDQEAVDHLPVLIQRLTGDLDGRDAVITHPYEGGHPDHDAAALAVQAACARLGDRAPVRLEFAGYHLGENGLVSGVFADDDGPQVECPASDGDMARKKAALACHASQARVLARFQCAAERLRLAPTYDFSRPPAPGRVLYDGYGWAMTSARWRERAGAAAWA